MRRLLSPPLTVFIKNHLDKFWRRVSVKALLRFGSRRFTTEIKIYSKLCPFWNLVDCSQPGSLPARMLEWVAISFSRVPGDAIADRGLIFR